MPEPRPAVGSKAVSTSSISPFEQDKLRRQTEMSAPIPISVATPYSIAETRGNTAISLAASAEPNSTPRPAIEMVPSPALALNAATSVNDIQNAVVAALTAAGQTSAAESLTDATWALADGEARIQTTLSKTLLHAVMNPDAEKIARTTLRDAGILKFTLLTTAATAVVKKPRPARTGSVQAKALEHPMVQQAQKLFHAEIQTVIDLREPD